MLDEIGLNSIDELFADIPDEIKINGLDLPDGKSEYEVEREIDALLSRNTTVTQMPTFLGAGVYHHYIPTIVSALLSRAEFYTCYTPYQPEISQGILQALFEYQSLIAELTGMDVANTSMYDAPSALGEAVLMAARITRRREFLVPRAMHWEKKEVLLNYVKGAEIKIREVPYDIRTGKMDLHALADSITEQTAGVYIENPNFFGVFEDDVAELRGMLDGAMLVVGVHPLSLGIVKSPGDYGADIVIGEGQPLGNAMNFGGPLLGIFACRQKYVRKMPGRIIGLTKDRTGRRAFCMTLQTREQHIRRSKATSNICSNEALCAVAAAVYLSALGKSGLGLLATANAARAKYLAGEINKIDGFEAPLFKSYHFNEFVVRATLGDLAVERIHELLFEHGVHGGLVLKPHFPELGESMLLATTEAHRAEDHARFINSLKAIAESTES
jgi:glycine dehydrogenase subunit 1